MGRHIGLKRRLHYVVLVGLLLLAGLTSSFAAERIKELRVAQIGNPSAMDCWNSTAVDESDIIRHFLEPLFDVDREGTIQGAVAESWEMKSPTEWILRIRKGIKFHDPEYGELKAEDVVASLDSCVRETARISIAFPKPVLKHQAEIVDEYTIRLTMPEPGTGALPNNFAYAYVYPKKYLELGKE
jgi:peptide/nickel transport system substrate-binding protein